MKYLKINKNPMTIIFRIFVFWFIKVCNGLYTIMYINIFKVYNLSSELSSVYSIKLEYNRNIVYMIFIIFYTILSFGKNEKNNLKYSKNYQCYQ